MICGVELKFEKLEEDMSHVGASHGDVKKMVGRETVYDSSKNCK